MVDLYLAFVVDVGCDNGVVRTQKVVVGGVSMPPPLSWTWVATMGVVRRWWSAVATVEDMVVEDQSSFYIICVDL